MVTDPTYVSVSSVRCPVTLGVRVDPLSSENGPAVWNDGLRGIEWSQDRFRHRFVHDSLRSAYPTHDMRGVVVIFRADDHFGYPDNAIILNADCTVRCRVRAPRKPLSGWGPSVMRIDQAFWARRPSGEICTAITITLGAYRLSDGQIKPWISDYYEEREIDVQTGECIGELLGSGRW